MTQNNTDRNDSDSFDSGDYVGEWTNISRPRGIFTETDRKYILNEIEDSGATMRSIRYRVRQHLREGLLDLILLNNFTPHEELHNVVQSTDAFRDVHGRLERTLLELSYRIVKETDSDLYQSLGTASPVEYFEKIIESVLDLHVPNLVDSNGTISMQEVSVNIEIQQREFDKDKIRGKLAVGEATYEEFDAYFEKNPGGVYEMLENRDEILVYEESSDQICVVTTVDDGIHMEFYSPDASQFNIKKTNSGRRILTRTE